MSTTIGAYTVRESGLTNSLGDLGGLYAVIGKISTQSIGRIVGFPYLLVKILLMTQSVENLQ